MAVSGRARWAKDDNHGFSIGGFGIVMLFNLWGILWPKNKRSSKERSPERPPANAAALARQAFLASRTDFSRLVPFTVFHGHQLPLRILREVKRGTNRKRNFWRKQKGAALRLRYVHF